MSNTSKGRLAGELLLPGLAALAALFAASAGAQGGSAEDGSYGLEEIIVTAEKWETNLQTTPISVTALDGQYLDDYGIDSVQEMGNRIVGFAFEMVDRADPGLFIRGSGGGSRCG